MWVLRLTGAWSTLLITCPGDSDVGWSWKLGLTLCLLLTGPIHEPTWYGLRCLWLFGLGSQPPPGIPSASLTFTAGWTCQNLSLPWSMPLACPAAPMRQAPRVECIPSASPFGAQTFSPGPITKPTLMKTIPKSPLSPCPHDWNQLVNHKKLRQFLFLKRKIQAVNLEDAGSVHAYLQNSRCFWWRCQFCIVLLSKNKKQTNKKTFLGKGKKLHAAHFKNKGNQRFCCLPRIACCQSESKSRLSSLPQVSNSRTMPTPLAST